MTSVSNFSIPVDEITVPATVGFILKNIEYSFLCENCNIPLNIGRSIDPEQISTVTITCHECSGDMIFDEPFYDFVKVIDGDATIDICEW